MKMILRVASFLMLSTLALSATAAQARRVALVIGNGAYSAVERLANPPADANLVAQSLRKAGFTSVEVRRDLGKSALEKALRDFGKQADGAELALIYYAGHGIEVGGQNYLIPTDARLERDRDVDLEATRLDTLLTYSEGAKLRVVILDACRNNPFVNQLQRSIKTRSIGRGLAAVEPGGETLVVYAAKAGATAADGTGSNSPFAQALARRLPEPGIEINMVFRRVRDDVLQQTNRSQEPFSYGSLSGNEFYFVQGRATAAVAPATAATVNSELEYWHSATATNTEGAYRAYLKRYPNGEFADMANENLRRFAPKPAVAAQRPASQPAVAANNVAPTKPANKVAANTTPAPAPAQRSLDSKPIEKGLSKGIDVSFAAVSQVFSAIKKAPGAVRNRGADKQAAQTAAPADAGDNAKQPTRVATN
ncbi:MAG TPA: caspase family protein [Steroidobacteraceae bacterium]|jgi:hypothetical protein|nr:caspase family protein [Steroidobacteraceae bacterium]